MILIKHDNKQDRTSNNNKIEHKLILRIQTFLTYKHINEKSLTSILNNKYLKIKYKNNHKS